MSKATTTHTTPNTGCILRRLESGRDWLQLVAAHDRVVLDTVAHPYDTLGQEHIEHASVTLSVAKARELRDVLERCIEQAEAIDTPAQPGLWSDVTMRRVAWRAPKRWRGRGL